jgi:hypothetical protein
MYPLQQVQADVHEVYTTETQLPLQDFNSNHAWDSIIGELDVVRLMEGSSRTYFGLVRVGYSSGLNGMGYVGVPTAVGSDDPSEVRRVVAHELGHTWGRYHSPCGNPGGLDPDEPYPYPGGLIGVYGFDVAAVTVKAPSSPDIMSYCPNAWISDYTYQKVLDFRAGVQSAIVRQSTLQPSIIIWGRILNGQPVLEPAFQIVTRPSLPARPGPYTIEARADDGTRLFAFSFDATVAADGINTSQHFAFAIPLDADRSARLQSLQVSGPGGRIAAMPSAAASPGKAAAPSDDIVAESGPQGLTLKWNASAHPLVMVRDPDTGHVLSLVRGGSAQVWTQKREVDLEVSDGIRSHHVRRAISR